MTATTQPSTTTGADSGSGINGWAVGIVVVLLIAVVVVAVLVSRRRRAAQTNRMAWDQRRDDVLEEALDAHDRITALVGRWALLTTADAEQLWSAEDVRLGRVRDHLRSVVSTATDRNEAMYLQVVVDAVDDVRVALANSMRAKAEHPGATLDGSLVADAAAALLNAIRRARRAVAV